MDWIEEISTLAAAKLVSESHFIVDVVVSSRTGPKKVLVILDGDQGVTIDDCARLSRDISNALDERPFTDENYTLEVSTPGLDQPLKLLRQFKKNTGRKLKIKRGDQVVEGKLTAVSEDKILLEQETGSGKKKETRTLEIPFSEIDRAFVVISFK